MPEATDSGTVTAAHGRHFQVTLDGSGEVRQCYTRGKRAGPATGDRVRIRREGQLEGVITEILPRRNLFFRSDERRSKQLAANIDQLLFVVAGEPPFSTDLLGRALVAARHADIPLTILLNKTDLPTAAAARSQLRLFETLDIPIIALSALDTDQVKARLAPCLAGRVTLLLGQSGMGKSTVLNALIPEAGAATRAHSEALQAGRHTTTHTRLYRLAQGGQIIDSPGFQAFGLQHLQPPDIALGFPELIPLSRHCRFQDCTHRKEPGCAVLRALEAGEISKQRLALYQRILAENEAARRY